MTLSVIFTTYNSPAWLEKVLWGYSCQLFKDFEVIVADDGSNTDTADLIYRMQQKVEFPLRHIWHEDKGFRKCEILNKAIVASDTDYLVFSDGDCIPRSDFLLAHFKKRKVNCFLSGGAIRLPMSLSETINRDDILNQAAFNKKWLANMGMKQSLIKGLKLTSNPLIGDLMNKLTPTKATWNGGNASAWKKDILAVNGFDERMRYGAQDREFGERLVNNGVEGIQIRYSAVCLHLEHGRGYVNKPDLERNAAIRRETKQKKIIRTPYGIEKDSLDIQD